MRIRHRYLTFEKNDQLTKLLASLAVRYKEQERSYGEGVHSYFLEFFLYEDNPRFGDLKEAFQPFGIEPQVGTLYDRVDEGRADWFIASTGQYQYPQPEEGFGFLEATFNLDHHCRHCGMGKVQNAPYRLKTTPKQHNSQFWGLHWEYEPVFVRQEAKNILEEAQIQGIRFTQPVLHKKNTAVEGFYQLHVDTILPPGFDPYITKQITCKINNEEGWNTSPGVTCCGRVKYYHPMRGGYLFDPSIFDAGRDIALTHEYFGSGASACRLLIVSKRFKEIIEEHQMKGLALTPVVHHRVEQQ